MPYLLEDARSHSRSHIYAGKGEQVTVIAEHGTVIIVEDNSGQRFPVLRSLLGNMPIIENPQPAAPIKPIEFIDYAEPIKEKASPAKKTKAKKNPGQQSIF